MAVGISREDLTEILRLPEDVHILDMQRAPHGFWWIINLTSPQFKEVPSDQEVRLNHLYKTMGDDRLMVEGVSLPEEPVVPNYPDGALTDEQVDRVALLWHDKTCPEGPECRDRALHANSSTNPALGIVLDIVTEMLLTQEDS